MHNRPSASPDPKIRFHVPYRLPCATFRVPMLLDRCKSSCRIGGHNKVKPFPRPSDTLEWASYDESLQHRHSPGVRFE